MTDPFTPEGPTGFLTPDSALFPGSDIYPGEIGAPENFLGAQLIWRFYLAESSTLERIGEITQARNKTLVTGLNNPGSFSFSIHHEDEMATEINPVTTSVICTKNGEAVWSGPVWTLEDQVPNKTLQVTCIGWFELLNHRLLLQDINYALVDAGVIISDFINTTNTLSPTGITLGDIEITQIRSRSYKQYQNIGQEIMALTQIENGFDWYIHPATKKFNVLGMKMVDQTNVIFGYGWGPSNLDSVSRTIDSSTLANSIYAVGRVGSAQAGDSVSQYNYGLYQTQDSLSDIADQTILAAYVNEEVTIKANPRITYTLVPTPYDLAPNKFSIFEDYDVGDKIYFVCNTGRIQTGSEPQAQRVFGVTVNIDDNGIERISSLQTSPT